MTKPSAMQENTQDDTAQETMLGAAVNWRDVTGKGRGIFARRLIRKGEVIEISPVVPMAKSAIPEEGGPPDGYVLEWRDDEPAEAYALVLGYIMFYNHGEDPNVHLESDFEDNTVTVTATRDIQPGEEIIWNYNCDLWFDPV